MIGIYPLTCQGTHFVSIVKINRLILSGEIMIVYCDIHTKDINKVCGLFGVEMRECSWRYSRWYV